MKHLNHLVLTVAAALLLLNAGLYFKTVENARIRSETYAFEKLADSIPAPHAQAS